MSGWASRYKEDLDLHISCTIFVLSGRTHHKGRHVESRRNSASTMR